MSAGPHHSHPEWVEIITWNDFEEGTYVSPIDDPARSPEANADVLYLTANLKSPAELSITAGERTQTRALASGSPDVQVPLIAGSTPRFRLIRSGQVPGQGTRDDAISPSGSTPYHYYSIGAMHD